jgi:hypothetical protein
LAKHRQKKLEYGSAKLPDLAGLNTIQKDGEQKCPLTQNGWLNGSCAPHWPRSVLFLSSVVSAEAQTPFYQASEQQIAGPPGTPIRQEPMFGAPDGAAA